MGRKQAPQPLSLAEPQSYARTGSGPNSSNGSTAVSPSAITSSAPNSSSLGPQSHRSPRGIGETNLQVVPTPTSSKSPRSPRSPFSKFNTSKKGDTRQIHTSHAQAPSQLQSKFSQQASEYPQFDYKAGPVAESYDQAYYHYPQDPRHNPSELQPQQQNAQARKALALPRSQSNVDAGPTTPALRDGAGTFQFAVPAAPVAREASREEEKHTRSASRFFNFKSSKTPQHRREQTRDHRPNRDPSQSTRSNEESGGSEVMSRGAEQQPISDRVSTKTSKHSVVCQARRGAIANIVLLVLPDHAFEPQSSTQSRNMTSQPSRSDLSLAGGDNDNTPSKKGKPKPFTLLSRTRSMKERESPSPKEMATEIKIQEPERVQTIAHQQPLRTAPVDRDGLAHDRSYRQMMDSSARNHSADRVAHRERSTKDLRPDKDHGHHQNRSHPSSFKENSGSTFLGNLKNSGSRAADIFSNRFFGNKSGRSASTTEREPTVDDEHYQLKVINLPLVEQARKTRISKKLEDARDKTEFWMPAFPWRAIDYLNYKGSDVEGLYRVPGSGPQIKKWQRKFDEEYDVDLFAQEDLYDINIVGSMLKAWLRELPDELFPKEAQERIARECSGAETVPQLLIDELSNLQPYNYYLLFAITCHLSLLLAHSEKNRMDFRNLCICFQPCLKIDAFCFRFLVCDWRDCWKGCKNEAKFIEEEYALMQQPPPVTLAVGGSQPLRDPYANGGHVGPGNASASIARGDPDHFPEERYLSSSDSSNPTAQTQSHDQQQNGKLRKKPVGPSGSLNSISTGLSVAPHDTSSRTNELRPLSPIKPLSPLNF
ncbi:RhoGAP domain-containing protein [Seiridium cupressi]